MTQLSIRTRADRRRAAFRRKAGRAARIFVLLTVLIDATGMGLIFPVMPDLLEELTGQNLSGAAVWGGVLGTAYAAMQFLFGPVVGNLSDAYGRRPVMLTGAVLGVVLAYPIMMLVGLHEMWAFALAIVLSNGILQGIVFGPFGAFCAELFPTRIRYTGASLAYQSSSTFGAGFAPMIAAWLLLQSGGELWLIGVVWAVVLALTAVAIIAAKEGKGTDIS